MVDSGAEQCGLGLSVMYRGVVLLAVLIAAFIPEAAMAAPSESTICSCMATAADSVASRSAVGYRIATANADVVGLGSTPGFWVGGSFGAAIATTKTGFYMLEGDGILAFD